MRLLILFVAVVVLFCYAMEWSRPAPAAAKTETLTCVRIKEVTPAGTINYLCEVRK